MCVCACVCSCCSVCVCVCMRVIASICVCLQQLFCVCVCTCVRVCCIQAENLQFSFKCKSGSVTFDIQTVSAKVSILCTLHVQEPVS